MLRQEVVPVCYGGAFTVATASLHRAGSLTAAFWGAVATRLARGNNIEEGHMMERLWAPLLAAPTSEDAARRVLCAAPAGSMSTKLDYRGGLAACSCGAVPLATGARREGRAAAPPCAAIGGASARELVRSKFDGKGLLVAIDDDYETVNATAGR